MEWEARTESAQHEVRPPHRSLACRVSWSGDEPLTREEVFAVMAQAVGRKRLWQPPALLMRVMAGVVYDMMSHSLRVSNRHFKEVSGCQPLVANARVGWALIIEESRAATPL